MEYRPEFDPVALDQIRLISDYLAEKSVDRSERWSDGLFESIDTLKILPKRCPVVSGLRRNEREVREHLYRSGATIYRVFFAIEEDRVVILELRHSSQDDRQ